MNKVPVTVLKQTNANERKQTCSRTPFANANEHEPLISNDVGKEDEYIQGAAQETWAHTYAGNLEVGRRGWVGVTDM